MPILTILIVLVVVGVLLWLVNTYVPMNGTIKKILNIVVIVAVAIWLLNVFGVFSYLSAMNYTQTKDLCVSRFIDFSPTRTPRRVFVLSPTCVPQPDYIFKLTW